jgi:LAGLIDADG endonuclease
MKLLIKFFDCGKLYPKSVNDSFESAEKYYLNRKNKSLHAVTSFVVNTRNPIKNKIISFFDKYPLFTTKNLDYKD